MQRPTCEQSKCSLSGLLVSLCVVLAAVVHAGDLSQPTSPPHLIESYITAAAEPLGSAAFDSLRRIHGTGSRLLALRSYLRDESQLTEHWSWTDIQIAAYAGSDEQRTMDMNVERVRKEFEKENPGYTLFVNTEVRSLERQLEQWNRNRSVAAAAQAFERAITEQVQADAKLRKVTPATTQRFITIVKQLASKPAPTLAAPGLSRHGQMRAVDFQIRKGSQTVAGADSTAIASRWVADGWADKLHAAVSASGAPFSGPLTQPQEPWHYEYQPAARAENQGGR